MKERADVLIYKKGYTNSREKAKRLIMSGSVFIGTQRIDKPGQKIDVESDIIIKGENINYVGRGGLKLEKAIKEFKINLEDKVCIDIGSSTGGFTDCMLQFGANKVYAIDVGYGQLDWSLREDKRVVVMERTNIRNVTLTDIGEKVDFISIDVSFISLELVLPVAKKLLKKDGIIVALIKPQFEAGKEQVGKKGIIRDKKVHLEVIEKIDELCKDLDINIDNISYSPIKGAKGNIEFIVKLTNRYNKDEHLDIEFIVDSAHKELKYG